MKRHFFIGCGDSVSAIELQLRKRNQLLLAKRRRMIALLERIQGMKKELKKIRCAA